MLINLSNHPSVITEEERRAGKEAWSDTQLNAAIALYGKVEDMRFPNISPEWTTEQVEHEARQHFEKCRQLLGSSSEKVAVHLAGEATFCFILAQLLLKAGYRCFLSTSERIVNEKGNRIGFEFQLFRDYKLIDV